MRSVSDLAADFSTTPEPNVSCGCVETATAGRSAQRGSVLDRLLFGVRGILLYAKVSKQVTLDNEYHYSVFTQGGRNVTSTRVLSSVDSSMPYRILGHGSSGSKTEGSTWDFCLKACGNRELREYVLLKSQPR